MIIIRFSVTTVSSIITTYHDRNHFVKSLPQVELISSSLMVESIKIII